MKQQIIDYIKSWLSHREIANITGVPKVTISRIRNEAGLWVPSQNRKNIVNRLSKKAIENIQYIQTYPIDNSPSKLGTLTTNGSPFWDIKLEEKITRNENENYHEVKYEWDQIKTKEQFFKLIEFDESKNEILSYQCNKRQVVIRVSSTQTKLIDKREHFLRVKPITWFDINTLLDKVEKRLSSLKYWWKNWWLLNKKEWKLLEICLFDAHINKKSYNSPERNCEIARNTYMDMVSRIIEKAKVVDTYDKCLLVIWNDWFNSDWHSKTTSWTPQDNTENEETAFAIWLDILVCAIDMIAKELECVVEVISIPWNHARVLEQVLWTSLKVIYRNNGNVIVNDEQSPRKYFKYWNTAIMFSHWDGCKQDMIPMLFANENPKMRWDTKYKQVHLWHIHSKTVTEKNWVIIRHLSSMTTTDRRHSEQWYIGNRRWGQAFIFDKELGEEAEFNFYV